MTPLVFEGCAGWLHPAGGDVGVLMCGPIGLEALCLRRGWRMLAGLCADAGYPTLRFDYPGWGDSAGDPEATPDVDALVRAVARAGETLRRRAGVSRLVFVGHGLGAALAVIAARPLGAEAVALCAPLVRGGAELRAQGLWGRVIAEGLGLSAEETARDGVAGFRLPTTLQESIARLDLTATPAAPAAQVFLAARAERALDHRLGDRLRGLGAEVAVVAYGEHGAALGPPTLARPPLALFEALLAWLLAAAPIRRMGLAAAGQAETVLHGEGFLETALRFGPGRRLAGVLCEPRGQRAGTTALLLNAGGDPHGGWARSGVDQARALARRGAASFRIDLSDIGDSAGPPSPEPPRICDPRHVDDALAAVEWLEARGLGPVMAVGRCSGASVALAAAMRDARIRELVLVNPRRFSADYEDFAEAAGERLARYRERLQAPAAMLRRALRGELHPWTACRRLGWAAARRGYAALIGHRARARRRLLERFEAFAAQGRRTTLVCTTTGPAWDDLEQAFGPGGGRLRRTPGVEIRLIEAADHNLTPAPARAALAELLCERALDPPAPVAPPRGAAPADRRGAALGPAAPGAA